MIVTQKLSNLQLELIKTFSQQLDDTQLLEIRDILAKYFAKKATQEMDKLMVNNEWTNDTMDTWANEHLRTPCKD